MGTYEEDAKDEFAWNYYWHVDLHGLTERQAQSILEYASATLGLSGSSIDPREWCTVHMDQSTAAATSDALQALESNDIAQSFRETIEHWLNTRPRLEKG